MIGPHYESKRLSEAYEEQETELYKCPNGHEFHVPVEFHLFPRGFYPIAWKYTECPVCGEDGDKI